MRDDIFEALSAVWVAHKGLKAPAELGRVMSVPKKDKKKNAKKKAKQ
jgi:carnitine 3-dehydrogenase